jgi:hypothetical protein
MSISTKRNRSLGVLIGLIASAALFAAIAAPASADLKWSLHAEHSPTNLPPGGQGQYIIKATDVGDSDSNGPYALTAALPPGVTVSEILGRNWNFAAEPALGSCTGNGPGMPSYVGATSFTCTAPGITARRARAAYLEAATSRGSSPFPLIVNVSVDPLASEPGDASFQIFGGNCGPTPSPVNPLCASSPLIHDEAHFGAPAGFGFRAFAADAFEDQRPAGAGQRQAGSHPFELRVDFAFNNALGADTDNPSPEFRLATEPDGSMRTLETRLPAGLIGDPQALPQCDLLFLDTTSYGGRCPSDTQVGTITLYVNQGINFKGRYFAYPVFNLEPPVGSVAAFGFSVVGRPVIIGAELDPTDHDTVVSRVQYSTELSTVRSAELTLWGVPGDPAHDWLRQDPQTKLLGVPFEGAPVRPFLTLPGQCESGGPIVMRADSWQRPGAFTPSQEGADIKASGCQDPRIHFEPTASIQPTSHEAAAPTGLDVDLSVPQSEETLENPSEAGELYPQSASPRALATPPVREVITQLPEGMAIDPSAADGLSGCSQAQVGLQTNEPVTCPDSSKLGSVEVQTPLLGETLDGNLYQAVQGDNPFGSLLALYIVIEDAQRGLRIKLPARIEADPQTGRLTVTVSENPQLPFSHLRLHIWGGQRAPLVNPPGCGSFAGSATITPWNSSLPSAHLTDLAQITSGPGGSSCPGGAFAPRFRAGSLNPLAGAFSPFALEVSREEGSQGLASIETTLPAGLLAKLAGVPACPEAALAAIPTAPGSGVGERAHPSCPAASFLGHLDAAAGAGLPFHNPAGVYLAGPYKGAPLSLAVITPIVGGPLDLGNVLTRVALHIDPSTAQVRAVSDPLPSIIAGIPLDLRSLHLDLDRPGFTLNPTSCEPSTVGATLGGLGGASASLSDRFQVTGCAALPFGPELSLRLKGAVHRTAHPKLIATLTAKPGEANIARAQVKLPAAAFLDNAHIREVCTRVQFNAGTGGGSACPVGSIYGRVTATSPLLDYAVSGPVFLRSSSHELPDLVAVLRGPDSQPIEVDLVGRTDSVHGALRNTFEAVPDVAVSRFRLELFGGKRGLIEMSTGFCAHPRATVKLDGQNGKIHDSRPTVRSSRCAKPPRQHAKRGHR